MYSLPLDLRGPHKRFSGIFTYFIQAHIKVSTCCVQAPCSAWQKLQEPSIEQDFCFHRAEEPKEQITLITNSFYNTVLNKEES